MPDRDLTYLDTVHGGCEWKSPERTTADGGSIRCRPFGTEIICR